MIQRIQSLYLLAVSIISGVVLFAPLTFFATADGSLFDLYASSLMDAEGSDLQGFIYMLVLAVGVVALPLVTIFLFKNRMLQLRLCVVEIVLQLGLYVMIGVYFYLSCRAFADAEVVSRGFHPALFAPAVSMVLSFFAAKAIFKDEILVRSVDRIR